MQLSAGVKRHSVVRATINYFDKKIARGRFDVIEPQRNLMEFEPHQVEIFDMRACPGEVTIEQQGFTFARHPSKVAQQPEIMEINKVAQFGTPPINQAYYDELLPFIKQRSGAREVIPQATGLTVRYSPRSTQQSWAGAAGFAHLDVTTSSFQRFLDASLAVLDKPLAPWRRVVMYQTWRVVAETTPVDNVLAVCDRRSVPTSDVTFYDAFIGDKNTELESIEARTCKYGPEHRWWYLSDMSAEDVLVFIGYDSADPDAVQPFHSGFDVPGLEQAMPRASLEARFFAFYD